MRTGVAIGLVATLLALLLPSCTHAQASGTILLDERFHTLERWAMRYRDARPPAKGPQPRPAPPAGSGGPRMNAGTALAAGLR